MNFFLASPVKDDNKEEVVLLNSCGSAICKLSKNLVAPKDIGNSSYGEIKRLMGEHKNPKRN